MSSRSSENILKAITAILYELQPVRLKDLRRWRRQSNVHKNMGQLLIAAKDSWIYIRDVIRQLSWNLILSFVVWCGFFTLFHHFEFERVYVIISLFFAIFYNLGVKNDGELSAYSVFNSGVRRLLGQMTAEQFENELLHRERHERDEDNDNGFGFDEQEFEGEEHQRPIQRRIRGKKARRTYEARLERQRTQQAFPQDADFAFEN